MKLFTFLCFLVLSGLLSGFPIYGQNSAERKSGSLEIATWVTDACSDDGIRLGVRVTNFSRKLIVIDTLAIGDMISFSTIRVEAGGVTSSNKTLINDHDKDYKPNFVVLDPGRSFDSSLVVSKKDDFFEGVNELRLTIFYRQYLTRKHLGVRAWVGSIEADPLAVDLESCTR